MPRVPSLRPARWVAALLLFFAWGCARTFAVTVDDTKYLNPGSTLHVSPSESIVIVDSATTNADYLTSLEVLLIGEDDTVEASWDGKCIKAWARFYDYGKTELTFCPVPPRAAKETGLVRSVAGGKVVALGEDEKLYKLVASEWKPDSNWGWVGTLRIAQHNFYAVADSAEAHLLLNVDINVHGLYSP
jgi:hypothetical protein